MSSPSVLDKRDRIAGLDRGLRLIEAFDETHPRLSPSTAARRTGMTRAAARRYLLTLQHLGYVESDGKLFSLTPRVLRLGWSYVDSANVARIAMLPCWPQEEVERWLSGRVFLPFTPYTVTTVDGVRELIAAARSRGYALLEQQLDPGMRGIAVPIRSRTSEVVGGISVSLPMGNEPTGAATSRALPVLREVEHSLLALL